MKKNSIKTILAIVMTVVMMLAVVVPAMADEEEAPIFNTTFTLVNNEPEVQYDEYEVPYNVWVPASTAPVVGEKATVTLTYTIPETVEDYDARLLASIEYIVSFTGMTDIELVEAQGCPTKLDCNYEDGWCMPIFGEYSNITVSGDVCTVMAELNSNPIIVLRGTVTDETINCNAAITIGQYRFPAQYLIGNSVVTVEKSPEGYYNAHRSDFTLVQKRSVEYRNVEGGVCNMFAGLNGHYYRLIAGDHSIDGFVPVDEEFDDDGEPIDKNSELFATLSSIFDEYKELFNVCYCQGSIADVNFFNEDEHYGFEVTATLDGEPVVEPTEEPVEPTAEPTAEPVDPSPVPETGMVSFAVLGIAAIVGGAVVLGKKKEN